ncbi:MAG: hypothetical protein QW348_02545 [Ignisphaera sp.]
MEVNVAWSQRFLRDRYSLAALIILLLSIAFIIYSFWPRVVSSPHINVLEDYVRAVQYLNKSSIALEGVLKGFGVSGYDFSDVYGVRMRLERYLRNVSAVYGSDNSFFVGAAKSYLYVASASVKGVEAYRDLNSSVTTLRESLELLALCRVDEALEKFGLVEDKVVGAIGSTASAIDILRNVNSSYLAENHVGVVNASLRRFENVFKSLQAAYNVMQMAKSYRDVVEALCKGERVGDQQRLAGLKKELEDVGVSGPLSLEVMNARNKLLSLIQQGMPGQGQEGNEQGSSSGSSQGVGGGAGYVPPESDD